MDKLTVSVVGGGVGGRLSLKAAACSEHYELVALADLRPEVSTELRIEFPGLQIFADFREMFRVCPTGRGVRQHLSAFPRRGGARSAASAAQGDTR
jgi:hypothetical protein